MSMSAGMTMQQGKRLVVPVELATAWERALHTWSDGGAHDAVLGLATKHQQFAWVAARYREITQQRSGDAVAAKQLARLQRAAIATYFLTTPPSKPERTPYRGALLLLGAAVVAAVVGLRVLDMKVNEHRARPAVATHAEVQAR